MDLAALGARPGRAHWWRGGSTARARSVEAVRLRRVHGGRADAGRRRRGGRRADALTVARGRFDRARVAGAFLVHHPGGGRRRGGGRARCGRGGAGGRAGDATDARAGGRPRVRGPGSTRRGAWSRTRAAGRWGSAPGARRGRESARRSRWRCRSPKGCGRAPPGMVDPAGAAPARRAARTRGTTSIWRGCALLDGGGQAASAASIWNDSARLYASNWWCPARASFMRIAEIRDRRQLPIRETPGLARDLLHLRELARVPAGSRITTRLTARSRGRDEAREATRAARRGRSATCTNSWRACAPPPWTEAVERGKAGGRREVAVRGAAHARGPSAKPSSAAMPAPARKVPPSPGGLQRRPVEPALDVDGHAADRRRDRLAPRARSGRASAVRPDAASTASEAASGTTLVSLAGPAPRSA